jgi:hypothetical protein
MPWVHAVSAAAQPSTASAASLRANGVVMGNKRIVGRLGRASLTARAHRGAHCTRIARPPQAGARVRLTWVKRALAEFLAT